MFASQRLTNLLRSSLQIIKSGYVGSTRQFSGKYPSCYIAGKRSTERLFLLFSRRVSQLAQENEGTSHSGNHIRMKGLPYEATTEDVISFFKPLTIEHVDVAIERNRWGRPNGFASVKFKSYDEALRALRYHRKYMGPRYIELSLGTKQPEHSLSENPHVSDSDFLSKGHKVILKGIPYEATVNDIEQFFAPLNIKPSNVEMKYGRFNLPSGICECTFDSHEDALTALKNHRVYIGRRWIEVFLASDSRFPRSNVNLQAD